MKKTAVILISLILIVLCTTSSFCEEHYEIDIVTREIISGDGSESVKSKRLSTNCTYDFDGMYFVYSLGANGSTNLTSTVYNGECVSETVIINAAYADSFSISCNGQLLNAASTYELSNPGYYIVTDAYNNEQILSFTILSSLVSNLEKYEIPSIFYIVNIYFDGSKISTGNMNYVKLDKEGEFTVTYRNNDLNISRTVSFVVDKTAPVLEISGPVDGIAKGPVTLGSMEEGSTLSVIMNGESIAVKETYTNHGTYHLTYTDAAGNVSNYDFVIRMYLDANASWTIGILLVIIAGVAAYMVYLRKHMRTY